MWWHMFNMQWKTDGSQLRLLHRMKWKINNLKLTNKKLSCRRETVTLRVIEYFAKSLKITHGHSKWHCWVGRVYVPIGIYWNYVCRTVYEIFSIKEWRNLETGGRGRSRSLKMAPFDRSYTTFYWSAILSIAVCCTIFQVIWRWIIVTLKWSLKVIQTGTIRKLGCGFLFAFHSKKWSYL